MAAPTRLKCDPEIYVKKGGDHIILGVGPDTWDAIVLFHDEIPELIEVLTKIITEKK